MQRPANRRSQGASLIGSVAALSAEAGAVGLATSLAYPGSAQPFDA
jgi:hypothetical protein